MTKSKRCITVACRLPHENIPKQGGGESESETGQGGDNRTAWHLLLLAMHLLLLANIVTTSKELVTTSDALVTTSEHCYY